MNTAARLLVVVTSLCTFVIACGDAAESPSNAADVVSADGISSDAASSSDAANPSDGSAGADTTPTPDTPATLSPFEEYSACFPHIVEGLDISLEFDISVSETCAGTSNQTIGDVD